MTLAHSAIPEQVLEALEEMLGTSPRLSRLGGMSGRVVLRASDADGTHCLIVKGRASPAEAQIYRSDAGLLAAYGVPIPRLYWSEQIDGEWWLVLEEIPRELPRGRWLADPELLAVLHRLHHCPLKPPACYQPDWSSELTEACLSWFAGRERDDLDQKLAALRRRCQPLFEPLVPISGDPNPRNWGIRADGSLVLFDWERCTLGSPAIDLAIAVPGLGSPAGFQQVAAVYLSRGDSPVSSPDIDLLASQIKLAKAWVLVEFLANASTSSTAAGSEMQAIAGSVAAQLPGWLATVFGD